MKEDFKNRIQFLQSKTCGYLVSEETKQKERELAALEKRQESREVTANVSLLTDISKKIKQLQSKIAPWKKIHASVQDVVELIDISELEDDEVLHNDIQKQLNLLEAEYSKLDHERLFNEDDALDAYISVNAGAGGREACDWAGMLYRMYQRWAELRNFKFQALNALTGEESGLKSAEALIQGKYVYGQLKTEVGVHRLVRISPFDSAKRRHTSFASIAVTADIKDDDFEIEIKASDLRIDTFRASGAGGQHVNTTDSAVRITHLPTHLVVSCQAERSQFQNKERAMKLLKAKLYEHSLAKKKDTVSKLQKSKMKIEWGSQIRSYVFHPYQMVKDHRSSFQTSALQNVLDGEIDAFIQASLAMKKT